MDHQAAPPPAAGLCHSCRAAGFAAAALAVWALASPAQAQDFADLPPRAGDPGAATAGVMGRHEHWASESRPFVAAVAEVGIIYLRPTLAIGYGQPHRSWIGLETTADISQHGGAEYVGIHGTIPHFDARAGLRYEYPANQYFLSPRRTYSREAVEQDVHGRSRYLEAEAELAGWVPFPGGRLFAMAGAYYVFGTPDDLYVFEEALKVVIEPPFLWRARLGYLASLGWDEDRPEGIRLGVAGEVIHGLGRGTVVVRAGPVLAVELNCHLDAVAAAMLVVAGPDNLGLLGADFGQLGLRYRWATGDPVPAELPW